MSYFNIASKTAIDLQILSLGLHQLASAPVQAAGIDWHEDLHPRAKDGRFGSKSGKAADTDSPNSQNGKAPEPASKSEGETETPEQPPKPSKEDIKIASDVVKDLIGTLAVSDKDREDLKKVPKEKVEGYSAPGLKLDGLNGTQKALIIGAGLTGLGIAGMVAAKLRYAEGIKKSAELAKQLAKEIKVEEELATYPRGVKTPSTHITVPVGGFDGKGGKDSVHFLRQQLYQDDVYEKNYKGQFFTFVENKDFNLTTTLHPSIGGKPDPKRIAKAGGEALRTMLKRAVKQGYNEDAVRMAATAIAYAEKHPDKDLNLLGMSAGGMITHTAQEILHEVGVKAKVANLGSPWFGMSTKKGASVTISSNNDWMMKHLPSRDTLKINSVWGHLVYQDNKEAQSFLGRFLSTSSHEEADSLRKNWRTLNDGFGMGEKDTTAAIKKAEAEEAQKFLKQITEFRAMTPTEKVAFKKTEEGRNFTQKMADRKAAKSQKSTP